MQKWRSREQDERDHRDEHDERPRHDRHRDGVPPAATARVGSQERQPSHLELRPEEREQRGKEGKPVEDRARDDDRARESHRRQERALVEQHPGEADRDGDAGERHGTARGRHRDRDRLARVARAQKLLAEAARDEKRIVDGHTEADERHDVLRVHRHVRDVREQVHARDAAHHRKRADAERDERRDERPEHEDQEDERERERDDLGALQVREEYGVEAIVDREHAGGLDLERVALDLGAQLRVVVTRDVERVLHRDIDRDRVPILRDLPCRIGRGRVERCGDGVDARVRLQRRRSRVDRGTEPRVSRGERVRGEDQRECGAAGARELALDQLRCTA